MMILLSVLALGAASSAQQPHPELAVLLSQPVIVEREAPVIEAPFDWRMRKIFIEASIEGESAEFIFDTGSPSMISRALADRLDLTYIGQNTGFDANGQPVTMDFARVDMLQIGEAVFRNVPVLVFDFSALPNGQCIVDGGVIGSEIFAGSAWRIDVEREILSIAAYGAALTPLPSAFQAPLGDFGYPHAPIIDYAIGELSDKALFDTGSGERVALFERVAMAPEVEPWIDPSSLVQGRGSEGESAGGLGATRELARGTLESFELGEGDLGPVRFALRGAAPTLLGAGLLDDYIVTMDYPAGQLQLAARETPSPRRVEAGYGVFFTGDQAGVVQLYHGSNADLAGLELGDTVLQIGDVSLAPDGLDARCEAIRWLTEGFDPAQAWDVLIERDGARQTLHIPATAAE